MKNKITIIDLINKIANGEEVPKYVKYYDKLHKTEDIMLCCYNNIIYKLDNNIIDLLDEVEILDNEDEDIEEIDFKTAGTQKEKNRIMKDKINELVRKVNKLKKEGK